MSSKTRSIQSKEFAVNPGEIDFHKILETLSRHKVEFIVVGGICAVLHGAPVTTFDIDLVHSRKDENLERLLSALKELEAFYREKKELKIRPTTSHIATKGHHLLMTKFGPLDLLGIIGKDHDFEELASHTEKVSIDGQEISMLDLETLIAVKAETARDKDNYMLAILRQTLKEKNEAS